MLWETDRRHRAGIDGLKAIAPYLPAILLVAWPLLRSFF
jgi:hypothetical protein